MDILNISPDTTFTLKAVEGDDCDECVFNPINDDAPVPCPLLAMCSRDIRKDKRDIIFKLLKIGKTIKF